MEDKELKEILGLQTDLIVSLSALLELKIDYATNCIRESPCSTLRELSEQAKLTNEEINKNFKKLKEKLK